MCFLCPVINRTTVEHVLGKDHMEHLFRVVVLEVQHDSLTDAQELLDQWLPCFGRHICRSWTLSGSPHCTRKQPRLNG